MTDQPKKETLPRIMERPGLPPAFIIEEEDIDTTWLPTFPEGVDIPFSVMIDDRGHCHIEYNHCVYNPTKVKNRFFKCIKWFFDPDSFYYAIPPNMVAGSLLLPERTIIGGMNCHYYSGKREAYLQYWGILTPEQLLERGMDPECRKGISRHHYEVFDRFAARIGARTGITSSPIPATWPHGEACGYHKTKPTLPEWWELFKGSFPISLRRFDTFFRKIYY